VNGRLGQWHVTGDKQLRDENEDRGNADRWPMDAEHFHRAKLTLVALAGSIAMG
jgi:hypothetical protein